MDQSSVSQSINHCSLWFAGCSHVAPCLRRNLGKLVHVGCKKLDLGKRQDMSHTGQQDCFPPPTLHASRTKIKPSPSDFFNKCMKTLFGFVLLIVDVVFICYEETGQEREREREKERGEGAKQTWLE